MAGALHGLRVIDFGQWVAGEWFFGWRPPTTPGRLVSPPGGAAQEVLAMLGMPDKLNELVQKRVIVLD